MSALLQSRINKEYADTELNANRRAFDLDKKAAKISTLSYRPPGAADEMNYSKFVELVNRFDRMLTVNNENWEGKKVSKFLFSDKYIDVGESRFLSTYDLLVAYNAIIRMMRFNVVDPRLTGLMQTYVQRLLEPLVVARSDILNLMVENREKLRESLKKDEVWPFLVNKYNIIDLIYNNLKDGIFDPIDKTTLQNNYRRISQTLSSSITKKKKEIDELIDRSAKQYERRKVPKPRDDDDEEDDEEDDDDEGPAAASGAPGVDEDTTKAAKLLDEGSAGMTEKIADLVDELPTDRTAPPETMEEVKTDVARQPTPPTEDDVPLVIDDDDDYISDLPPQGTSYKDKLVMDDVTDIDAAVVAAAVGDAAASAAAQTGKDDDKEEALPAGDDEEEAPTEFGSRISKIGDRDKLSSVRPITAGVYTNGLAGNMKKIGITRRQDLYYNRQLLDPLLNYIFLDDNIPPSLITGEPEDFESFPPGGTINDRYLNVYRAFEGTTNKQIRATGIKILQDLYRLILFPGDEVPQTATAQGEDDDDEEPTQMQFYTDSRADDYYKKGPLSEHVFGYIILNRPDSLDNILNFRDVEAEDKGTPYLRWKEYTGAVTQKKDKLTQNVQELDKIIFSKDKKIKKAAKDEATKEKERIKPSIKKCEDAIKDAAYMQKQMAPFSWSGTPKAAKK